MKEFLDSFIPLFGIIVVVIGGFWGLVNYRRNNRIKAAELLLGIEKDYSTHIPTLLQIENIGDYEKVFKNALKIAIYASPDKYTPEQSKVIDQLETVLRHFFVCANIRRLNVDAKSIDDLYAWYLNVLVTDVDSEGKLKRPELHEYIRRYWPTIYFWAYIAAKPFPRKILTYIQQIPARLNKWLYAAWTKPYELSQNTYQNTSEQLKIETNNKTGEIRQPKIRETDPHNNNKPNSIKANSSKKDAQ